MTPEEREQLLKELRAMEATPEPTDDATLMGSLDETQPIEFEPGSPAERMESQIVPATEDDDRNVAAGLQESMKYKNHFDAAETDNELPPGMLMAIAAIESSGNPAAIGPKTKYGQAKGLMQFMEDTARDHKLRIDESIDERLDPVKSINAAGAELRMALLRSKGDIEQALVQYNWGAGNWGKWLNKEQGFESMPPQTASYIGKFRSALRQYQRMSDAQQVAR